MKDLEKVLLKAGTNLLTKEEANFLILALGFSPYTSLENMKVFMNPRTYRLQVVADGAMVLDYEQYGGGFVSLYEFPEGKTLKELGILKAVSKAQKLLKKPICHGFMMLCNTRWDEFYGKAGQFTKPVLN